MDGFNNATRPPVQNRGSKGSRDVETRMGTPAAIGASPLTEVAGVPLKIRNGEHPIPPAVRMNRSAESEPNR